MSDRDAELLAFADDLIDRYFTANPGHNYCETKVNGKVFKRMRGGDTVVATHAERNKRRNARRAARR